MFKVSTVASLVLVFTAAAAQGQVFYPQAQPYQTTDNLDVELQVEAFTTDWGEGYSGVSYGAEVGIDLSPSVTLELEGRKIDTTLGSGYEYGAGINIHGPRGELYASINSLTTDGENSAIKDLTRYELGGEYQVNNNLRVGFEASGSIDAPVLGYDAISSPYHINTY